MTGHNEFITTKAIVILERKFGDRFVIKHESGNSEQFCQFRGGGDIFIFNRTQPLEAIILTEESNSDDLEVGDTHELSAIIIGVFLTEESTYISSELECGEPYEEGGLRCGVIEQKLKSKVTCQVN